MSESTPEIEDYVEEDLEPTRPLSQEDIDLLPDIDAMLKEVNVDE